MPLLLAALIVLGLGGLAAVLLQRSPRLTCAVGAGSVVASAVLGLIAVLRILLGGAPAQLRLPWGVPFGSFYVELDPLSAFFLLPLFVLSALAAVYGSGYLRRWAGEKALGPAWLFFNLLVASMAVSFVARNGVLFLVAWETMSLASFFLVAFESEEAAVRQASWTYLVAMHLGTAFLLALFVLLGRGGGSLDFDRLGGAAAAGPGFAGLLFVLGLIGFGTKAGFMPLHVWLPEAHPAAPSHVSAVMSGVMIKAGIYGLLRLLTLLGPPPAWWGWTLVGVGITSGILGVLFALAQHDLKRLLAYHSVENVGIITLGLGLGLLGVTFQSPTLAVLGFAGGLLHVINHALFKGLLFLGAGTVLHATGTRDIDHLGGLLKRLPWTGAVFLVGAAAIAGLPPLNGFVSEILVYLGAFTGVTLAPPGAILPAAAVIAALALIGGLAAACFAKAFGAVFLGEPRAAGDPHEPGWSMRLPPLVLAAACGFVGLASPLALRLVRPVLPVVTGWPEGELSPGLAAAGTLLSRLSAVFLALVALAACAALVYRLLLARHGRVAAPTWDCGYARPTARMQYTASSFAQPIVELFGPLLRTRKLYHPPRGYFPARAEWETDTPDVSRAYFYDFAFKGVGRLLARLRWLQQGRLQIYVLYIAVTLIALLLWKVR